MTGPSAAAEPPDGIYELRVKVDGRWKRLGVICAQRHTQALRQAMLRLTPDCDEYPICLEQVHGDDASPAYADGIAIADPSL